MNRITIVLCLLQAVLSGCAPEPETTSQSGTIEPLTEHVEPDASGHVVVLVSIRLVTIEVPSGIVSRSEDLWSYLDEEPIGAETLAVLGRNGLRMGIGRADTWPDVAKLLTRMTGQALQRSDVLIRPGAPLPITLKEDQPVQTIWVSRRDLTLRGRDFPPGDNLITVAFTIDLDDPSRMVVTGQPQLRTTQRYSTYRRGPGGFVHSWEPSVLALAQLTFRAPMRTKDFLVIGPGAESGRSTSTGRHFLVRKKKGMDFETVLVLVPHVVAAKGTPTPAVTMHGTPQAQSGGE